MHRFPGVYIFLFAFLLFSLSTMAKVSTAKYGVEMPYDSARAEKLARLKMDSIIRAHPQMSLKYGVSAIMKHRHYRDRSADFYLLSGMLIILGLIRFSNARYFNNLFGALLNPTRSNRQLKEQIQATKLSNLLMNIFFTISAGVYIYYIVMAFAPQRLGTLSPSVLLILLVVGMMVIYLGKYAVIRFSGWAFRLEGITDFYLFNVFLINKIIAIAKLPFIVLKAFGDPVYAQPLALASFILIGVLFVNRYTRSWQVFGSFFQYSKFHFFMYLCASELLPLAVLMKLLVRGILYY